MTVMVTKLESGRNQHQLVLRISAIRLDLKIQRTAIKCVLTQIILDQSVNSHVTHTTKELDHCTADVKKKDEEI